MVLTSAPPALGGSGGPLIDDELLPLLCSPRFDAEYKINSVCIIILNLQNPKVGSKYLYTFSILIR